MQSRVLATAVAAVSLIAGALAATTAQAAVTYSFVGDSGSFTYLSADFVAGPRLLLTGDLKVCDSPFDNCTIRFFPDTIQPRAEHALSFEVSRPGSVSIESFYFFAPGAFSTPGVYSTVIGVGQGTLTVSGAPGPLGVPEPATWALMLAGFGAAGSALRAQRRRLV